jgi:hypothetical protein
VGQENEFDRRRERTRRAERLPEKVNALPTEKQNLCCDGRTQHKAAVKIKPRGQLTTDRGK